MIPRILVGLLLLLSPLAAEPAHAEARFRENRLVFARAIYSAIDVIRSHAHDRHDQVRGFLNLAHSSATTDQARNRLGLLLRDLTFEKATNTLPHERLWRIKRQELQALLAYERIIVPGDEGAIEGNLVEDLLKATLFGDMKDEVRVEYYPRDQKKEILALVLTYISDPRAGRYDQEVREFVYGEGMPDPDAMGPDLDDPLLKEPPALKDLQAYREWVRSREIPYLPPGEEIREGDVRPAQQRRQIIFNAFETNIPLPGKSAESRVLLRQMRTMAEAAAKNGAPFRPKVSSTVLGGLAIGYRFFGIRSAFLIDQVGRPLLAVTQGNSALWWGVSNTRWLMRKFQGQSLFTVGTNDVLGQGLLSTMEDRAAAAAKKATVGRAARFVKGVLGEIADSSGGWNRLMVSGKKGMNSIHTQFAELIEEESDQVLKAFGNRSLQAQAWLKGFVPKDYSHVNSGWMERPLREARTRFNQVGSDPTSAVPQREPPGLLAVKHAEWEAAKAVVAEKAATLEVIVEGGQTSALKEAEAALDLAKSQADDVGRAFRSLQEEKHLWSLLIDRLKGPAARMADLSKVKNAVDAALSELKTFPTRHEIPGHLMRDPGPMAIARNPRLAGQHWWDSEEFIAWTRDKGGIEVWRKPAAYHFSPRYEAARMEIEAIRGAAGDFAPGYLGRNKIFMIGAGAFAAYHVYRCYSLYNQVSDPIAYDDMVRGCSADLITDALYAIPFVNTAAVAIDIVGLALATSSSMLSLDILGIESHLYLSTRGLVQTLIVDPFFDHVKLPFAAEMRFEKGKELVRRLADFEPLKPLPGGKGMTESGLKRIQELVMLSRQDFSPHLIDELEMRTTGFKVHYRQYSRKFLTYVAGLLNNTPGMFTDSQTLRYVREMAMEWRGPDGYLNTIDPILEEAQFRILMKPVISHLRTPVGPAPMPSHERQRPAPICAQQPQGHHAPRGPCLQNPELLRMPIPQR